VIPRKPLKHIFESGDGAVRRFGLILASQMIGTAFMPVGKDYKPSSYLYVRRRSWGREREEKGVFGKALDLKDSVRIVSVSVGILGGELAAVVPSESRPGEHYTVKLAVPIDFECSCPWGQHRYNPCKHVFAAALKVLEEAGVAADRNLVYDSLNRLAYRKAKLDRELR
jgi:hypothetical protein